MITAKVLDSGHLIPKIHGYREFVVFQDNYAILNEIMFTYYSKIEEDKEDGTSGNGCSGFTVAVFKVKMREGKSL